MNMRQRMGLFFLIVFMAATVFNAIVYKITPDYSYVFTTIFCIIVAVVGGAIFIFE